MTVLKPQLYTGGNLAQGGQLVDAALPGH